MGPYRGFHTVLSGLGHKGSVILKCISRCNHGASPLRGVRGSVAPWKIKVQVKLQGLTPL